MEKGNNTEASKQVSAALATVNYTPAQQRAIDIMEGFIRVIAGAGTGKTKAMVGRVVKLLKSGVSSDEILMVTFTKAGAKEFAQRVEFSMGMKVPNLRVSTFNAFFNEIVADNWEELGFSKKPKVIDMVEQFSIIDELLRNNPIVEWNGPAFMNYSTSKGYGSRGALMIAKEVFKAVKKAKANGTVIHAAASAVVSDTEISSPALTKLIALYDKYEVITREQGLIDFDDQPLLTSVVLAAHPDYLDKHYGFKHIIVDEFQDTSEEQIDFLKKLVDIPTFESLMVVGDDFQSIYAFRNTSPEYIIHFEDYMNQSVTDVEFLENWRSTRQILEFGDRIIERNGADQVEKDLKPMRGDGAPVIVQGFYAKPEEIEFIVRGIKAHIADGMEPREIAVLCYTKNELRDIADALTRENIPSFFGAPEPVMGNSRITAILAFARLCIDQHGSQDALTCANAIMGGNILSLSMNEIQGKIQEATDRAAAISTMQPNEQKQAFINFIEDIKYDDEVIENFQEGLENKDFEEIIEYCREFALYGDGVEYTRTQEYPGVCLVTAHSSKGREWPVVYMSVTKYQKGEKMPRKDIQEMRRLMYVSSTRARDELFVTGLYGTGSEKTGRTMNTFVMEAYDAMEKVYNPVWPVKETKVSENKTKSTKKKTA